MVTMPTWDQFMTPMLRLASDGKVRRLRELRDDLAGEVLTPEQQAEVLPSGESKADNRIGWAASYLNRVGALDRPSRGHYVVTDFGRKLLARHPQALSEMGPFSTADRTR